MLSRAVWNCVITSYLLHHLVGEKDGGTRPVNIHQRSLDLGLLENCEIRALTNLSTVGTCMLPPTLSRVCKYIVTNVHYVVVDNAHGSHSHRIHRCTVS